VTDTYSPSTGGRGLGGGGAELLPKKQYLNGLRKKGLFYCFLKGLNLDTIPVKYFIKV
jgi:hypothetical protein